MLMIYSFISQEHISVHTGEALYACPICPMTFSSSANMYKHRRRLHKAEYEAYRQQAIPPNIIKQAKKVAHTIRLKNTLSHAEHDTIKDVSASTDPITSISTSQYIFPLVSESTEIIPHQPHCN